MVVSVVQKEDFSRREVPDIFRAASNNDPIELERALYAGQSLNTRHAEFYRMTPMHIACLHRSTAFLDVALSHEFNAWVRDANGRLSMDHAAANGLHEVAESLAKRLYPTDADGVIKMPFDPA